MNSNKWTDDLQSGFVDNYQSNEGLGPAQSLEQRKRPIQCIRLSLLTLYEEKTF